MEDNPALLQRDWLPEEPIWSELRELRDQHVWFLDRLAEVMAASHEIMNKFRAEDVERAAAAKRRVLDPNTTMPKVTPQPARDKAMGEAAEEHGAVLAALAEFLRNSTDQIAACLPQWLDDLRVEHEEANKKIAAAQQMVADAEVENARLTQMEMWLSKHRDGANGRITAWGETTTPTPEVIRNMATGHQDIADADGEVIGVLRGFAAGAGTEVEVA